MAGGGGSGGAGEEKDGDEVPGAESVAGMALDARVEVSPGARRGSIKFLGEVPTLRPGFWVGVQFDEPVGRNDGSHKGVVYFNCAPGFGAFVRPKNVAVGDFPVEELDFSDSDDEDGAVAAEAKSPASDAIGGGAASGSAAGLPAAADPDEL